MENDEYESPIPDEYLREIGRIVVSWNKLESLITHTLVLALIDDMAMYERALSVFLHTSFPQKLDALSAMLYSVEAEFAELYRNEVQGKLKEAQEKRNASVHHYWHIYKGDVVRANLKARGRLKVTFHPISLEEVTATSLFIDDAHDTLLAATTFPLSLFKGRPQQMEAPSA